MGRIIDRLHSDLVPHDPLRQWCAECVGCAIACRKLCAMFGWSLTRGTVIPWAPVHLRSC